MRPRKFAVLAVVTVALIAAAVVVTRLRAPSAGGEKALLFPQLQSRINDIGEIDLKGKGRGVTLVRQTNSWVVKEADGYPALFDRVRQVAVGVAQLRVLADKTRDPALYDRLGVEDPASKGANSILLTIRDRDGKALATVIAGKNRHSAAPGDEPGLYVRLPDSKQALLVQGRLDLSVETPDWFQRELFDISADRIREIRVQQADGSVLKLARADTTANLELSDMPAGMQIKSDAMVTRMGTLLEAFSVDGVRSASKVTFPGDACAVTVTTFDGLVANIAAAEIDGKPMARFAFSYDASLAAHEAGAPAADGTSPAGQKPDKKDVPAEVNKLQAAAGEWVFQVPQYKFELFTRRMEDMVKVEAKEKPEAKQDTPAAPPAPASAPHG